MKIGIRLFSKGQVRSVVVGTVLFLALFPLISRRRRVDLEGPLLDVVDDDDPNVVRGSPKTIAEVHGRGLPHRTAWMYVHTTDMSRFLFVHRSKDLSTCPDTWIVPAEHAKVGESMEDAAIRGLDEELSWLNFGAMVPIGDPFLYLYQYPDGRFDKQWTQAFSVVMNDYHPTTNATTSGEENSGVAFWSPKQIATKMREAPSSFCHGTNINWQLKVRTEHISPRQTG